MRYTTPRILSTAAGHRRASAPTTPRPLASDPINTAAPSQENRPHILVYYIREPGDSLSRVSPGTYSCLENKRDAGGQKEPLPIAHAHDPAPPLPSTPNPDQSGPFHQKKQKTTDVYTCSYQQAIIYVNSRFQRKLRAWHQDVEPR